MKLTGGQPQCFRSSWRRLLQLPVRHRLCVARLYVERDGLRPRGAFRVTANGEDIIVTEAAIRTWARAWP